MRICPFQRCGVEIPDTQFACLYHWRRLNKSQRQIIWDAYGAYRAGKIGLETLRRMQDEVLDAAEGRAHA